MGLMHRATTELQQACLCGNPFDHAADAVLSRLVLGAVGLMCIVRRPRPRQH